MLGSIICRLTGHRISRSRVWNDGVDFRTTCLRCDQPLLRDHRGWRLFNEDDETDTRRLTHPKSQI